MELKTLIDQMAVQQELLEELLQLLERETTEMGSINVGAMDLTNQGKEQLSAQIAEQTPHLQQAISACAIREGLAGTVSLGSLAAQLAKKGNRNLLIRQQQLLAVSERVQRVAALNREIAEHFAASVTTSLGLITRLINQSNVYGASGGYQQRPAGAVMINREA